MAPASEESSNSDKDKLEMLLKLLQEDMAGNTIQRVDGVPREVEKVEEALALPPEEVAEPEEVGEVAPLELEVPPELIPLPPHGHGYLMPEEHEQVNRKVFNSFLVAGCF